MAQRASTSALENVVIVGAGQAGAQAAVSLRDAGFAGAVTLIGDEPDLPYGRPPLSKTFLLGKTDRAGTQLRSGALYGQHAIALRIGERVARIDRAGRMIALADGAFLGYDHLILATGARNRTLGLPGSDLDGIFQLRTLSDAEGLKKQFVSAERIVIVGAGFIGLEFAAVSTALGKDVTLIEATQRPLSRAASLPLSTFLDAYHRRAGVRIVYEAAVSGFEETSQRVSAVITADGRTYPADLVLVGIGVIPNAELAVDAGLPVENGIVVDAHLLTDDPAISAIGDCAAYPHAFAGGARLRLEAVQNAVDHARCVAERLAGRPQPYRAVPWFWSDQGSLRLQIAGLATPHDLAVLRGDHATGAFSVFCFADERLIGVESVNRAADHIAARNLLKGRCAVTPQEVADPGFDLRSRAAMSMGAAT